MTSRPLNVKESYTYCQQIAKREAGNFYLAFYLLPKPKRLAMCALYAFFRLCDDLADQSKATATKRQELATWRYQFRESLAGNFHHPLHAALHDAVAKYAIPSRYLEEVIDGVEMDLSIASYETFDELYPYCYRVASAVGLACICIWGYSNDRAKVHAEAAGIAFQLTNILRDLKEDFQRGRIYVPFEDFKRFGYDPENLGLGLADVHFQELMNFEIARAREYYKKGWPLMEYLDSSGRGVFAVMMRIYSSLLDAIARRPKQVFEKRIRLSGIKKITLALGALPSLWQRKRSAPRI